MNPASTSPSFSTAPDRGRVRCAPGTARSDHGWRLPALALALTAVCGLVSALPARSQADDAEGRRCNPCVGLSTSRVTDLELPPASDDSAPIFLHLEDPSAPVAEYEGPLSLVLDAEIRTQAPLLENATALEEELGALAERLERTPSDTRVRLLWTGGDPATARQDWDFLIKRAAVAVTGARPEARLLLGLDAPDTARLAALTDDELVAYIDGIAFQRDRLGEEQLQEMQSFRDELAVADPDSELVILGLEPGEDAAGLMAQAARVARIGGQIAIFDLGEPTAERLAPLALWSREFAGDITFDPYSSPAGASTWSFVRGEDLGLRVVVEHPGDAEVELEFTDRSLSSPRIVEPDGTRRDLYTGRRTGSGYRVTVRGDEVASAFVLALEREGLGPLEGVEGVEERVDVEDVRQMPVEEILRRLQASEDAQGRRLRNFVATNSTSLRFLLGGAQSLDTTFRGPFFYREDGTYDWAWEEFFVNGVRWRRKTIPEIPLIQPEKATAQPVDISFTRDYVYRLRGTATIDGRDTWVVDFSPAVKPEEGRTLYRGTVWVDRELFVRIRTNAVQLGLTGDVISNEETTFYEPLDATGEGVPWSRDAFVLATRVVGQQLFAILGGSTAVEREVLLTDIRINPGDFDELRQQALESDVTMVRDTEKGLRYLVEGESGERVVKDELDKSRMFLVGGVFYDESQDYPLPLAGLNWLNFDWRGTGIQTNFFFAGPLLVANVSDPSLFGSRWSLGIDAFGLAIAGEDTIYRDGEEVEEETVEALRPNIDLSVGRPIGQFLRVDLEYSLGLNEFSRADDTAEDFVVPEDHLDHRFRLRTDFTRRGYRLRLQGSHNIRGDWEEWGLPGNDEFDPDQEEYKKWSASLRKVWHLPKFTKFGVELEVAGGENLDRFSKYSFGFFSDTVVRGYRSDSIRAEEIQGAHLSYGFNLADVFRVDFVGDAVWATDPLSGLEDELLAGVGLNGTVIGPWGTVVNFDIGFPVEGPEDGFTAYIAFLKLFNR